MTRTPYRSEDDADAISLHSIDIADDEDDFYRVDTNATEHDLAASDDEEMSRGLTSHAQRMSGSNMMFPASDKRRSRTPPPFTPTRILKTSAGEAQQHTYYGTPTSRRSARSGRSVSPLGRKVSLAVHKASARIVNFSNEPAASPAKGSPDRTHHASGHPLEKDYFASVRRVSSPEPEAELCGKSLKLFGPQSRIRRWLFQFLVNPLTESTILLLIVFQVVILTIDSSFDLLSHPRILKWGHWTDWALLGIFVAYTVEMLIRIIVSGLWFNPERPRTGALPSVNNGNIVTQSRSGSRSPSPRLTHPESTVQKEHRHFWDKLSSPDVISQNRDRRKAYIVQKAYLRHSFNRIDFVAVISFWLYFVVGVTDLEYQHHVFIFKALSCMRILRLLNVTQGTSAILQSLKKAAPLLVNVAFFVGFFWVFIAVIGVQSFKGSFRRQCVWVDPQGLQPNQTQYLQFCGGQWEGGKRTPYLLEDWQSSNTSPKGYTCPEQSWCVQDENPYGGTVHFDNFFNSLELVFVIMSSNTFTDLMYYTMDSDYFISALFFIAGTLLLTFWLMSLVIAVVTTSFQVIREEQHSSAFVAVRDAQQHNEHVQRVSPRSNALRLWDHTKWFWVLLIGADIGVQAFKSAGMTTEHWNRFETAETIFTGIFAFEIILRFACHFPNWRSFANKSNFFDLFLAVVTCVIQIPIVKHSGSLYRWLTIFQILRSYRIIRAVPFTRDLVDRILGNTTGLINLVFFVFCAVYIGAIVACQLVRGDAPQEVYGEAQEVTFKNIFNAFVGMYQILSSENWTTILYAIQSKESIYHQAWIGAIFFIVWFVFAQNILMSMFIAVLQENFEVSEDDKRREQVRAFVQKSLPTVTSTQTNLTMFSLLRSHRRQDDARVHNVSAFGVMQESHAENVNAFLDKQIAPLHARTATIQDQLQGPIKRIVALIKKVLAVPYAEGESGQNPFTAKIRLPPESVMSTMDASTMAAEVANAHDHRRTNQRRYLEKYPEYDKVLWFLTCRSKIRRACQKVVAPSTGERLAPNQSPIQSLWYAFTAFMYLCTVVLVILACITTPIYQKAYQLRHGEFRFAWFTWCDLAFTVIFSVEFIIKVLADGFLLTPNAYFRNTWNRIDLFVLCSLWVNLAADILDRGGLSRAFRAFKALRALRLVNISDATKATFHDVLIAGFWNIAGAAIVSLSLLIPMAIWGLNLFAGQLYSCNDGAVDGLSQCYYEFASSASNWNVWAPRSWENPQVWHFDSFGSSLLILFEIVSQEGWINVMTSAMAITGKGDQPSQDASAFNAVFFIIFNLLGAVFVLTLFIAVIIQNYSERSGAAYLTIEQRAWQEMKVFLKQVRPSRRPVDAPVTFLRRWCYFAVKKHSLWNKFLVVVYCSHILLLMTEHFPEQPGYATVRNILFLIMTTIYLVNIAVRIMGLGWALWAKSKVNIYNFVVVLLSFSLSIVVFRAEGDALNALLTADKVFLVLLGMNLIPAIDSLDQLFKTTIGAFPALASLMATWLVLFVTFAIAFNQIFGLTKIGDNGSDNINVRTIPKALVLLFRMSCGEGWNSIMHDHAISDPYCITSSNFFDSDCGSESWAYFLFIAWNIVSMYIFVNLIISLVYHNFSYVYQRSGNMSRLSRAEIRRFKATWAEFDDGSGFIPKSSVARFLGKLEGAFEVRVYPAEYSIRSILANCHQFSQVGTSSRPVPDLQALNRMVTMIDRQEIESRRASYNRLYAELMQFPGSKGVPFTAMLLIVSHNRFVDEDKSLDIAEFLHRRNVKLEVDRAISQECIVNFFKLCQAKHHLQQFREFTGRHPRPPKLSKLQVPTFYGRTRSPSPAGSPLTNHSFDETPHRSERSSFEPSHASGSQRNSFSSPSPNELVNGLDYNHLLAGSAWSNALELERSTSLSRRDPHHGRALATEEGSPALK